MSLLKQYITRRKRVKKNILELNFDIGKNKKYKIKASWDSVVYVNKLENYLLGFYFGNIKRLLWEKKYLGTFVSDLISKKANPLFS